MSNQSIFSDNCSLRVIVLISSLEQPVIMCTIIFQYTFVEKVKDKHKISWIFNPFILNPKMCNTQHHKISPIILSELYCTKSQKSYQKFETIHCHEILCMKLLKSTEEMMSIYILNYNQALRIKCLKRINSFCDFEQ